LRDFKPELEQFAVDTRRAPKRILHAHLPDQRAEVRLDLRPPSPGVRLPTPVATFLALPGSSFTEFGAAPVHDSALLTAGTQLYMRNGWSVMAKLDSEFAPRSQTYIGTARLRYTW
jgi:hypothetical protein